MIHLGGLVELKQLKYFITIVESGSLGKAAQKLEIGTSALSQQISKLEDELCTRLLQRNSTGVTPTPAGLAFFKQAQLVLRHTQYAIEAAHSSRLTGHVSVGFSPSIASVLGIPFMQLMSERYPDIKIHLVESLSGNLAHLVNARQLDIAIIFTQDVDSNWAVQPLLKEQMFLMAKKSLLKEHGFEHCIQDGTIDLEKINALPLALPSRRHGLRKFLDQRASILNVQYEIDGLHLLMNCVSHLNMATIQPVSAHFDYLGTEVCLLKIIEPTLDRVNYLISISEDELSPASLATKVAIKLCVKELIHTGQWPSAELFDY
jgi:LysR family transcriptional regulator, regulatory protein for tcuABC